MKPITRRQALKNITGISLGMLVSACSIPQVPSEAPAAGEAPVETTPPPAEKISLRWDVSDATEVPAMLEMGEKGAELFAQKFPQVEVKPEPPPENQQQQILTQMVAGSAPDIIGMCCDVLPFWAQKGQLLNLDPFVDQDLTSEQIKDYPEAHWNAFTNPHVGRYAMPMYMGSIVLYYNKDTFDAKGVPYPDDTWEWKLDGSGTYEEALRKLAEPGNKIWGGRIGDNPDRLQQKLAGNGGHWVDPDDDLKAAFDQPAALDALQWLYDRIWVDDIVIRDTAREGQNWHTLMGNGRIAVYENGDWQLFPMVETATYNWDVAPIPKGPVQRNTLATTDGWAIWKGTKAPQECWEFLKFLQTDEWNELMITIGLLRPSRLSLFDKWVNLVSKSVPELADKNLKAFGEAVSYATPLELFQFNVEATEIIVAARDETIRTGSNSDVQAVFSKAAQQVNEAQQKAKNAAS